MSFVENAGQTARRAAFFARVGHHTIWLTPRASVLELRSPSAGKRLVMVERLVGARGGASIAGRRPRSGRHNFLLGRSPAVSARSYAVVVRRRVWKRVDVRVRGRAGSIERDYVVRPGADPSDIAIAYRGIRRLRLDGAGALVIETALGSLREGRPRAFQVVRGRRVAVGVRYKLTSARSFTFELGRYRRDRPLVIDPTLRFVRYLGGSGATEQVSDVAVDGAGNVYAAGSTNSSDFPGTSPGVRPYGGDGDAFVTKLDPAGTQVYATYLGSDTADEGRGLAVDPQGSVYLTGVTSSLHNFPTTQSAAQPDNGGAGVAGLLDDAFVAKLDPSGAQLTYSTYLGGAGDEAGNEVAIDASGNAYVTGVTDSIDFPVANAFQPELAGTPDPNPPSGELDAFATRVNAAGSAFTFSTYLGGSGSERGRGIAVDGAGSAYVAGATDSPDLPTKTPLQGSRRGVSDAFVAKLTPAGSALAYSTYLGGGGADEAFALDLDGAGRAWVTGDTASGDFPLSRPAQPAFGGGADTDAFVAALDAGGTALAYGSYLGGASVDEGRAIALDAAGDVHVTGSTFSSNFPVKDAFQPDRASFSADAFVAKIDGAGGGLDGASYLGGSREDRGLAIAATAAGEAYVGGYTQSPDLPALGSGRSGTADGFVAGVTPAAPPAGDGSRPGRAHVWADLIARPQMRTGRPTRMTLAFGNTGRGDAIGVPVWVDGIPAGATVDLDVQVRQPPGLTPEQRTLAEQVPTLLPYKRRQVLPLFLPRIPAGATGYVTITLTVPDDGEFTMRAWADPPWVVRSGARAAQAEGVELRAGVEECLGGLGEDLLKDLAGKALGADCVVTMADLVGQLIADSPDPFFESPTGEQPNPRAVFSTAGLITTAIQAGFDCAEAIFPAAQLPALLEEVAKLVDQGSKALACLDGFSSGLGFPDPDASASPAVSVGVESGSSYDPNAKVGSRGRGGRFISGAEPLRYTIFFENLAQATAAAQEVVITDRLDRRRLDLRTLALGPVSVGRVRGDVAIKARSIGATVDLRPRRNALVRVEAGLDPASGTVTWRLRALDPATGQPPIDPLAGFLPPNTSPPDGEGSVTFTIKPKRKLRNGARIRNRASITFDQNPPIGTNRWTNRVDRARPTSEVVRVRGGRRPLAAFAGRDRGSGVGRFLLFASEDAGPFEVVGTSRRRRPVRFRARRGHRYAVYSAAVDRAGNLERPPIVGDRLFPSPRARRKGSRAVLRARFFAQGRARLSVSASGIPLLKGSRLGRKVARRAQRRLSVRIAHAARVTLRLKLPAAALRGRRSAVIRVAGRRGEALRIPLGR